MDVSFYSTHETVKIEYNDLNYEDSGGQGIIYSWNHRNKKYAIKVIPNDGDMARRLREIYWRIKSAGYLFCWDKIPGMDNGRLREYLNLNICDDWIRIAQIKKIDEGRTIILYTKKKSISLSFDGGKIETNLTIEGIRYKELIVRKEKGRLNIYKKTDMQPAILKHRLLPVGQGKATAMEFSLRTAREVFLFVFNWVDGISLHEYIVIEKPDVYNRWQIAKKVIDAFEFFEKRGIVHGDLYPDNFMVNNDYIYLIDMEGAGLYSTQGDWEWSPIVSGKFYPGFAKAPEYEKPDKYTQRWDSVLLLFYILHPRISPFFFLKRMDKKVMEEFNDKINKTVLIWPPLGIETMNQEYLNQNDVACIKNIRDEFKNYKHKEVNLGERIVQLLFSTFVHGFSVPKNRPHFDQIKMRLGL